MKEDIFELTLEEKLYRTKYEPDLHASHISVDARRCSSCVDRSCTKICPAGVYKADPNDNTRVVVSHESCLECGTCLQVCPLAAIDWKVPDGGRGVKYRFG